MRRRSFTAIAIAVATVFGGVAAAHAEVSSPYTVRDPNGDAAIAMGDITALTIVVKPDRVRFTVRVAQGHYVRNTPAWHHPQSRNKIDIRIDAIDDARTDFRLIANSAGVNLWSVPSGGLVCEADAAQPALDRIVLWVSRTCLNDTTGVRAWAEMVWDRSPYGRQDSRDRAPGHGTSPLVVMP